MAKKSDAEVERGLLAVAEASGSVVKASKDLAQDGVRISTGTLGKWIRGPHAQRYAEIRAEVLPKIRQRMADQHIDMIERGISVERKISERLENEVGEIPARDLAGAGRNVATSVGIHSDTLRDAAAFEQPQKTPTLEEIKRGLAQSGVHLNIGIKISEEAKPSPVPVANLGDTEEET